MNALVLVMLVGAVVGAGLLLLVSLFDRAPVSGPAGLAQIDARRERGARTASLTADRRHGDESVRMRKVGAGLSDLLAARGVKLSSSITANLGIVGQSRETFLARTLLAALVGMFGTPVVPIWLAVLGAALGALLPWAQLNRDADARRRDFRHVVSSFLDLVAMNLAGGRGVPEALQSATAISDGWAMVRIRDTLEAARLQGTTPWTALGQLGDDVDVDELRDLAAALALVAEDGAKVRDSLSARASSMRRKELADAEGRAAAQSQSMLVAQLLLCVGFLLFLTYPAVARVLGG